MARICPALQQLLNTKEVSTLENLSSTPRRKPIKWTVLGCGLPITATIERMNRRVGAGLPLSTMPKRDGKHKSGMPVAAVAKTPKAPKPTKAPKAKPVKAPKPAKVKATKTKRGVKVVSTTATAKDVADAVNKAAGRTVAYAVGAVTSKPQVNLVVVLDVSGSMDGPRREAAAVQLTQMLDKVKTEFSDDSTMSVITFEYSSYTHIQYTGKIQNYVYPRCKGGGTALNDAVAFGVKVASTSTLPSLVYVFTDGEENASTQTVSTVKDFVTKTLASGNITLVGIGPKPEALVALGIPAGNTLNWTGNAAELASKVAPAVTRGVVATATAIKEGKKSLAHFFLDIDAVSLQDAAKKCVDVTATMERRNTVQGGLAIRDYIEKHCKLYTYVDGAYFYRLVTKEKLLKDRRIVIAHRDDTTGKLYSGPAARTLLGLPVEADVEVEPGSLGKWTVFVQSASPTRKTVRDAEFLWDKTATGNVKATFEYKVK
ncbi:MAG: VWA domain-containing protein, partial [Desulfurellales bacterium]